MNRILDAAEALLDEKSFQELSIQEIVTTAKSSVGAFYGRFPDKDALLHALDDRFFDTLIELIETTLTQSKWETMTLAQTVRELTRLVVVLHSHKQGLQRTLIMQARLTPDPRFRQREGRLWEYFPRLMTLVLAHRGEIGHEHVETAVQFGFLQLYYTAREMLLWPHIASNMPYQGEELVEMLALTYLNFLRGAGVN